MEQQWVRAVRLEAAGTVLHIVLQQTLTRTTAEAATATAEASNASQDATYQLCVLDAQGSRAWSSSFSQDDVEEALRQDLTDLGPELDSALAQCVNPCSISLHWSGAAAASQLHLKAQYDRQDFVPATFRLPPFCEMELQQGAAFHAVNARVLDVLTQQSSTLQQTASLLQIKLQELASHAQRVHDSYCEAVDSMAAQPGHDYTPGSIMERTAAAAAAAAVAAEPGSKRHRVGELMLPSLSPGGLTLTPAAVSRLDPDAVVGSQLPFSQDNAQAFATLPAAAAAQGSNGGSGKLDTSRPLVTPSKKGKPKQLSSHERMLQRVASGHRRLQQDWNGWLKQLLEAHDATEVQQAVAGRSGQQRQQQQQSQRGGLAAAGSGPLAQQQQQQEGGTLEAPSNAAGAAPAAAASAAVPAVVFVNDDDDEPVDDDDEIRIVHKPRAKKASGRPIFGTPKGKQHARTKEGSGGPAGA